MAQLLPLNVGPRPEPVSLGSVPDTESTSLNRACAWMNRKVSLGSREGYLPPEPAGPPRGRVGRPGGRGSVGGGGGFAPAASAARQKDRTAKLRMDMKSPSL